MYDISASERAIREGNIMPSRTPPSTAHPLTHDRRQELLGWLNGLLQLNFTKVEQCGTGYVVLQSIQHA